MKIIWIRPSTNVCRSADGRFELYRQQTPAGTFWAGVDRTYKVCGCWPTKTDAQAACEARLQPAVSWGFRRLPSWVPFDVTDED